MAPESEHHERLISGARSCSAVATKGRRLLMSLLDVWGDADWELPMIEDARVRLDS